MSDADDNPEILEKIKAAMAKGEKEYGHGLRSGDDTTQWGTENDSWIEMALEEALDMSIYKLAGRGLTGYDILNEMVRYTSEDKDMPTKLRNRIFSLIGDALHWVSVSQDDMLAVKAFLRRFSLE